MKDQAERLKGWQSELLSTCASSAHSFAGEPARKQPIALIALRHERTVATRSTAEFKPRW